jgi:hypothetical protein
MVTEHHTAITIERFLLQGIGYASSALCRSRPDRGPAVSDIPSSFPGTDAALAVLVGGDQQRMGRVVSPTS